MREAKFSKRIRFNSRTLDQDTPAHTTGKQFDYWGIDEGGLGLRVGPAGKSWVLNIRRPGNKSSSRIAIGKFPSLGLRDARNKAEDTRSSLRAEKPATTSAHGAAALTFGEAAREFAGRKKLRPITRQFYESMINRDPLAGWDKKPIPSITRGFVHAELAKITAPIMQNRARDFVTSVLRHVELTRDEYQAPRFSRRLHNEEKPRERVLSDSELAKLWAALDAQDQRIATLFRLLILLGTRAGETTLMRWSDLDLQAATWAVPADHTKSKRSFIVYLPHEAVAFLQGMTRWKGTEFVFSADGQRAPVRQLSSATKRIATAAGVNGWTPHDLRRTFRSGLDKLGIEPHVAELCMNHVRPVLERTYSPDLTVYADRLRAAWQSWAGHVAEVTAPKA